MQCVRGSVQPRVGIQKGETPLRSGSTTLRQEEALEDVKEMTWETSKGEESPAVACSDEGGRGEVEVLWEAMEV